MHIIEGFAVRKLGREYILSSTKLNQVDFNKIVALNETAKFLWDNISTKESFTVEDLRDLLLSEYEVEESLALHDAEQFAKSLIESGVATED